MHDPQLWPSPRRFPPACFSWELSGAFRLLDFLFLALVVFRYQLEDSRKASIRLTCMESAAPVNADCVVLAVSICVGSSFAGCMSKAGRSLRACSQAIKKKQIYFLSK